MTSAPLSPTSATPQSFSHSWRYSMQQRLRSDIVAGMMPVTDTLFR